MCSLRGVFIGLFCPSFPQFFIFFFFFFFLIFTLILFESSDGQAGVGRVDSPNLVIRPVPVLGLEGSVALVASGFRHSLFLTEGGRVFVCGFNRNGRLGLLSTTAKLDVAVPLQFPAPIRLVAVSCGYGHSAAVAADGRLFVWGHAADGALGLGDLKTASVDSPAPVTEGIAGAVASVSCGGSHTLALTVAGVLYGAGSVEALGPALAGPSFKSWEEAGEISLAKAGGKCCIAVAESRPHDVYVFGTIDFESLEKPPCDPQLRMVGAKGLIIDAGACTKMCSVLDDEGNLYVSKSSAFQQVPNISADQIGQGVVSLVYLEKKTKAVKIYSGSGQPTLVEGDLKIKCVFFFSKVKNHHHHQVLVLLPRFFVVIVRSLLLVCKRWT